MAVQWLNQVQYFYQSEGLIDSEGLLNQRLRVAAKRYLPTNGLVGWWPFNGNANDESGNENNGTASNMIWGSDRFGNSNSTAEINGVITRQIEVLNPIGINSNKKTLSSWIKLPVSWFFKVPLTNSNFTWI